VVVVPWVANRASHSFGSPVTALFTPTHRRKAVIVDINYMARVWRVFGKPKMGKPANDR